MGGGGVRGSISRVTVGQPVMKAARLVFSAAFLYRRQRYTSVRVKG